MNESQLRERVAEFSRFPRDGKLTVWTDTTEFMSIKAGDVLELGESCYLVRGEETETRFGLDGEPKFWVKRAVDLADGSAKIIKLDHQENFTLHLGRREIRCRANGAKEARVLDKTRDHCSFMKGITVPDSAGNPVRIVSKIHGQSLFDAINGIDMDHELYFRTCLPVILRKLIGCIEAIRDLHERGELHGDIRTDHILIERETGRYVWIDFNYEYSWPENPYGLDLFGLRNLLLFAVGKGFHNQRKSNGTGRKYEVVGHPLEPGDFSLLFSYRITNLRKLFPYVPEWLNRILRSFSNENDHAYTRTEELLADLSEWCGSFDEPAGPPMDSDGGNEEREDALEQLNNEESGTLASCMERGPFDKERVCGTWTDNWRTSSVRGAC